MCHAFKGIIILTLIQLTKREVEFIVTTLLRVGELGTVNGNYYMNYTLGQLSSPFDFVVT